MCRLSQGSSFSCRSPTPPVTTLSTRGSDSAECDTGTSNYSDTATPDRDFGHLAFMAGFWSQLLGWTTVESTDAGVYLMTSESVGKDLAVPRLLLFPSPRATLGKNRVHLALRPDDHAAEVEPLAGLGENRFDIGQTGAEPWVVMADPQGNEFCVLPPR
jgi:hypothetical protein